MVSIDRNWVGGLSSGLDTQGLIDKMIQAESFQKFTLERKRNTVSLQQSMLQDINLKLFNLQSKATDLTFSRTFNSKKVDPSDARKVNATASTDAAIGSYTVHVKQLATSTTVSSKGKLAGSLELGYNLKSTNPVGGSSTTLGALGVTGGDLEMRILSGGSGTFTVSTGAGATTSVKDMVTNINTSINAKPELKGKINATYDEKNNRIKFNLLDNSLKMSVSDLGASTIVSSMFEADGQIDLDKNIPTKDSALKTIRSGLDATVADLGIVQGTFTIERSGTGTPESFDTSVLAPGATVQDMINELNHQIDTKATLVNGGVPTGDPADRLVEFRFDSGSGKLQLVNKNSGDSSFFNLSDGTGDMTNVLFGAPAKISTLDKGAKLNQETFPKGITSGKFTVDGVQISIDGTADDLQGVLSRITALTDIRAEYDSGRDTIKLTRKDGSTAPIGLGSSTDSSNFLSVTGLIAGTQASAAQLESSASLGKTLAQAQGSDITTQFGVGAGTLKINVNGTSTNINYNGTESLTDILDQVGKIDGIDKAYYDASTGKVMVTTDEKGSAASLEIQDSAGTLASALGLATGAVSGSDTGSSIESARPISDVKTSSPLDQAGFSTEIKGGTFSINGVQFYINSTSSSTLDSLINSINSHESVGVKAHYDPTNGKFVLTSTQTGNTAIALGSATDTSNFLSAMGLIGSEQDVGQNAVYSVDGIFGGADQISQSNTVDDVIDGVTLELYDVTGASGEVIGISADTEVAKTAIDDFLELYNEVTETIYMKLTEERNWDLEALTDEELNTLSEADRTAYEEAYQIGLLSGDNTLRSVRSQMRLVMSSVVPGIDSVLDSLSDIGITTGVVGSSYKDTMVGTLQITDEEKLTKALAEDPDKVADLFSKDNADTNKMGIARRLKTVLNEFTKSDGIMTKRVGRSGVTNSNSQLDQQISTLNNQIADQEDRLKTREEALLKQFADLEKSLSDYQSQSSAFASQLAQLSGS
ncbi:MAG: flagellar filament capping protein FliD [Candidatus Riflebacteria bacterium]